VERKIKLQKSTLETWLIVSKYVLKKIGVDVMKNYDEWKQRREAKKYFRSQNQFILKGSDYAKLIPYGLLAALAMGALLAAVSMVIRYFTLSFCYIFFGYAMANLMKRLSNKEGMQLGILSGVMVVIAVYFEYLVTLLIGGAPLSLAIMSYALTAMIQMSLIGWIFMLAGVYLAYMNCQ
jgi:hypothetical protein